MDKHVHRKVTPCLPHKAPELLCDDLQPVTMEHRNPWFSVFSRGGYYTLEYDRPQVVVVPTIETRDILMIRVWRPVIGDCPLEFPAGDSLPGESPRDAAAREFAEETGIEIRDHARFKPELPISEMSGRIPVLLSVFSIDIDMDEFLSRDPHDDEIHSLERIEISRAPDRILSGEIYLSATCALIARLVFSSQQASSDSKQEV